MDLQGIEECPIDIQIMCGAWERWEITPHPHPSIFNFFYLSCDFHETWYIASICIGRVMVYEKNISGPLPVPTPQFQIYYLWSDFHAINFNGGP